MIDYRIRPVFTCSECHVIFGSYCKQWDKPICFACKIDKKDPNWRLKRIRERKEKLLLKEKE